MLNELFNKITLLIFPEWCISVCNAHACPAPNLHTDDIPETPPFILLCFVPTATTEEEWLSSAIHTYTDAWLFRGNHSL